MHIINHLNFEKIYEPDVGYRLHLKDIYGDLNKEYIVILFKAILNGKNFSEIKELEEIFKKLEYVYFSNDPYVGFAQCPITESVLRNANMGQSFTLINKTIEIVLFWNKTISASIRPNSAENLKTTIINIIKNKKPEYGNQNFMTMPQPIPASNFISNRNILPPLTSAHMFPRQLPSQRGTTNDQLSVQFAGPISETEIIPQENASFKVPKNRVWLNEAFRPKNTS